MHSREHAQFAGHRSNFVCTPVDDQSNDRNFPPTVGESHSSGDHLPVLAENLIDLRSSFLPVLNHDPHHPQSSFHPVPPKKKPNPKGAGLRISSPTLRPPEVSNRLPRRDKTFARRKG